MGAPPDPIVAVQIEPSRGHCGETGTSSAAVRITPGEIDRFLENTKPGETLKYHRGFLALDRGACSRLGEEAGQELDRIAAALLAMAEAGRVHLVQHRHGPNDYTYVAETAISAGSMVEDWNAGVSDVLRKKLKTVWTKLMVSRAHVRNSWTFLSPPTPPRKRGRPSSRLRGPTLAHFRARLRDGTVEQTVKGESAVLRKWQWDRDPTATPMARKYIEELIRNEYALHMSGQKME